MSIQSEVLRSDFLIHWTGKRTIEENSLYSDAETRKRAYISVLRDILYKGFRMGKIKNKTFEPLINLLGDFNYRMICFSEIKLSGVHRHTEQYGRLGLGFNRSFVIQNGGSPVFYIPSLRHSITRHFIRQYTQLAILEGSSGVVDAVRSSGVIDKIIWFLDSDCAKEKMFDELKLDAEAISSMRERLQKCQAGEDELVNSIWQSVANNILFVKIMAGPDSEFQFLDEAEWRIVWPQVGTRQLSFAPEDLRVLILPDEEIRQMAFADPDIKKWFGLCRESEDSLPQIPIVATVEECSHF